MANSIKPQMDITDRLAELVDELERYYAAAKGQSDCSRWARAAYRQQKSRPSPKARAA
jgi:hypothetical protein